MIRAPRFLSGPSVSPVDLDQDRRRFRGFLTRFAQIPDDEWAFIEPEVALATYARGEHVVHQGGSAARVVFILQGLMRAFYTSPSGDEATRNFAVEDDVISAYAGALTGKPSNVTIEALE